jgi:hypothetical protein
MGAAKKLGVEFLRCRPGLVGPVHGPGGKGIVIRHEYAGKVVSTLADLVILNGGLARCPCPAGVSSAPRSAAGERRCGFCAEPADIALSVIQAGNAAALACLGESGAPSTLAAAPGEAT